MLNDAGELEISTQFRHPIQILAGDNKLEFTRISISGEFTERSPRVPESLFVLRNMTSARGDALVVMDNTMGIDTVVLHSTEYSIRRGKSYTIGTEATPELDLSDTANPEHLFIRIGNLAGNLHFSDLYTKNGTIVNVHPEDNWSLSHPRRSGIYQDGKFLSDEYQRQQWLR